MLELYLQHGRKDPRENLDGWGADGPRLKGVVGLHETYRTTLRVFFATEADAIEAAALTGWERDDDALEIPIVGDLIFVSAIPEGEARYFGDWGLWQGEVI